jgi:hypothetical protein
MKKRALSFLLFGLALAGAWMGVLQLAVFLRPQFFLGNPDEYVVLTHQQSQLGPRQPYTNLVIGDSRGGCHFNPTAFTGAWLNLSIPGGHPVDGYAAYEKYLASGNRVDTLLIFYGLEDGLPEGRNFFDNLVIPHRVVDEDMLDEIERLESVHGYVYQARPVTNAWALRGAQLGRRLKYAHFGPMYRSSFVKGFRHMVMMPKKMRDRIAYLRQTLPANRGHHLYGRDSAYSGLLWKEADKTFGMKPINRRYLEAILELAEKRGTHAILVVHPFNATTYATLEGSPYLRTAEGLLRDIVGKYPHARLVMDLLQMPDDAFGDKYGHLNERGVRAYGELLRNQVLGTRS